MNAEIICIGTELLLGHIINTNASFIAARLAETGIDHYFQTTVGDNPVRLAQTIRNGLERSDIVITTGGLGPTVDDITAQTISEVIGKKLILEKAVLKEINEYFRKQGRKVPKASLRQTLIPEGAKWLNNPHGTAPGIIIDVSSCPLTPTFSPKGRGRKGEGVKSKLIIALPGPPREMQPMMRNYVIPYLRKAVAGRWSLVAGSIIKSKSIKLFGLPEPDVNDKVKDLLNLSGAVRVGIYAKPREVELRIMAKADNEKSADREIAKIERKIRSRLKDYIYGADDETLEGAVGALLLKNKKTIAVAESCTGGLLSNLLTNIPGSSSYFKEGAVTYSNGSKIKDLGISDEIIKKYGAVSAATAKEMAKGIKNKALTDIGVGITGIAGPTGATKDKPVGLVFIAIGTKNKMICKQFNFLGLRTEIKNLAAQSALDMLRCELL